MSDEIVAQLKYQNELLEHIAQHLLDSLTESRLREDRLMRLGESIEGFLSMIQGNTEG